MGSANKLAKLAFSSLVKLTLAVDDAHPQKRTSMLYLLDIIRISLPEYYPLRLSDRCYFMLAG